MIGCYKMSGVSLQSPLSPDTRLTEVLGTMQSDPPPAPLEPPKRFSKFPHLPLELRQMIWRCLFPGRCFVQILPPCGNRCPILQQICKKRRWWGKRGRHLPDPTTNFEERIGPETLRICRESREETLRYYIPLFKDEPKAAIIYIHPNQDILTLKYGSPLTFSYDSLLFAPETKKQLSLIKRVSYHWWDWMTLEKIPNDCFWARFKGVEELILQDDYSWVPGQERAEFIRKRLQLSRGKLSGGQRAPNVQMIKIYTAIDSIIHK
jgi:hypothetical protein